MLVRREFIFIIKNGEFKKINNLLSHNRSLRSPVGPMSSHRSRSQEKTSVQQMPRWLTVAKCLKFKTANKQ